MAVQYEVNGRAMRSQHFGYRKEKPMSILLSVPRPVGYPDRPTPYGVAPVSRNPLDGASDEDPVQVFARLVTQYRWSEEEFAAMARRTGMRLGRRDFGRVVALMRERLLEVGLVEAD